MAAAQRRDSVLPRDPARAVETGAVKTGGFDSEETWLELDNPLELLGAIQLGFMS